MLPERAIMSVWDRPLEANMELSWFKLKLGWGRFPFTLAAVELNPSSLPSSTGYEGPPACTTIQLGFHQTNKQRTKKQKEKKKKNKLESSKQTLGN